MTIDRESDSRALPLRAVYEFLAFNGFTREAAVLQYFRSTPITLPCT
jgi:hypothetical protein